MLSGKDNSDFGWDEHGQVVVTIDAIHHNFSYYDQLTSIYAKDRAIEKYAQTTTDIVKEIDVEDIATANNLEEGNNYHECENDVSLDEMDV
ncbi:hypothetical protein Golax_001207 [Gossypium laxum]|uniref:Uncharacterized protein n=1 Tax=Gossypium laxum TaxID=34288 RepID=A0A7J9AW14_9ROSI|nr:hypothetical protein [Gossypium laxum]